MPKTEIKVTLEPREVDDAVISVAKVAAGEKAGSARVEYTYDCTAEVSSAVVYFQKTGR